MLEGLQKYRELDHATVYQTANFDGLPQATKELIEPQLVTAGILGFHREGDPQFAQDIGQHLRGGDLLVVMTLDQVIGFALMVPRPELDAVYISGVVKKPGVVSGVIQQTIAAYLEQTGAARSLVRTQNDRVAEIMVATHPEVVALDRPAGSAEHQFLDQMGYLPSTQFDEARLIVPGCYGSALIGDGSRRRSGNEKIRALTDRLNYQAGDAVLLVGYR